MATAVVIGAGASKGALLPSGSGTPPLDAEFLTVARQLRPFKRRPGSRVLRTHYSVWASFNEFLDRAGLAYDEVDGWRLEQLSTFLEARATLTGLQLAQGRPVQFRHALEKLKGVVSSVLAQRGGLNSCEMHRRLFSGEDVSAVLSFNYDLIADKTLFGLGWLKWDAKTYRGASQMRSLTKTGKSTRLVDVPRFRNGKYIPLFKLHGSMNWERDSDNEHGHRLAGIVPSDDGEKFPSLFQPKVPLIIPPIAAKVEVPSELSSVWKAGLNSLYDASRWLFWGYSFPPTDTIAQVLFRTALERNRSHKPVVVVNPDYSVAKRVKDICRKVKVSYYPSIERYLIENHER